jgi:hypothetical protein
MSSIKQRVAAVAALAVIGIAGAGAAYAVNATATGNDGYTPVTQTRIYDSTRITGDTLMTAFGTTTITVPTNLVPAGADAVNIQLTAASETASTGDLDVNAVPNTAVTSNLNFTGGVSITSESTAKLTSGTFTVTNHSAGTVRLIVDVLGYYAAPAPAPATITHDFGGVASVDTGGSFNSRSSLVGTSTMLPAGSYLVTLSFKATPIVQSDPTVQVFPSVHLYNQTKNPAFAGDVLDTGNGALESGAYTAADGFYSNSGVVTVTAGTSLYAYAFGYDSNDGQGTYQLDDVTITATPVNLASN